MKIFVYEAAEIVPIEGLYEWLGDSGRIIFSNADKEIQNFDSREVIRLLESSNLDTAIFYVPSKIQEQFVELVNQQITNQWEEDNNVNVSTEDIGLIGNEQLSQFFKKMVLKKVIKPKGYETSEAKNIVRFDEETAVCACLNAIEGFGDKIAEAIKSNTQSMPKTLWNNSGFLTTLWVGVTVIVTITVAVIFLISRMITQPPFNEFHELKNENAQFQITIKQKDELLQQRENKLQQLETANSKQGAETQSLQAQIDILGREITQLQKKQEEKDKQLQQCKNKLQQLGTVNNEQDTENGNLQQTISKLEEKITQLQEKQDEKDKLLQQNENDLQQLKIANNKQDRENKLSQKLIRTMRKKITRLRVSPEMESLLSKLENENNGSRHVVIVDAKPTTKEDAQKKVDEMKVLYAEFGAGTFQKENRWLVFIGKGYTSKSAEKLMEFYIKDHDITKKKDMPYIGKLPEKEMKIPSVSQ
jgi:DNA repair exonuclease SbcCD ATPase subunit